MNINDFIDNFKSQLENDAFIVEADTDFVKAEFWDSLTNMVITVMLDDDYNIQMSSEELNSFGSVQELYDFVQSKQQ